MTRDRKGNFFMRPKGSLYAYCGCCGRVVMQDRYNLEKHGALCGFSGNGVYMILREGEPFYGYDLWKEDSQTLVLSVCEPFLRLRPGFRDRYEGGGWRSIYTARFRPNSRKVDENGVRNLDFWMEQIAEKKVPYVGCKEEDEVIESVFPVVPHIHDLHMFLHIYRNKGYQVTGNYQPSVKIRQRYCSPQAEELKRLQAEYPSDWQSKTLICAELITKKNSALSRRSPEKISEKGQTNAALGGCSSERIPAVDKSAATGRINFAESGCSSEKTSAADRTLLAVRVYRFDKKLGKTRFRCVIAGEGILWMSGDLSTHGKFCREIFGMDAVCIIPEGVAERFSQDVPSYGLANYLKGGGQNILIPLLVGGNYHKGLELLTRAGLSWFADHYYENGKEGKSGLFKEEPAPENYTDLPSLMSMPVSLLRQIPSGLLKKETERKRLAYIFRTNRPLLEGLRINESVLGFVMTYDVTSCDGEGRYNIGGIGQLPAQDLRRIVRYLSRLAHEEYIVYID